MQNDNQAAALFWKAQPPFCFALWRGVWYNKKNPPGGLTLNNE